MKSLLTIVCGFLAAAPGLAASIKRQNDGEFSQEADGATEFKFKYNTDWPDDKNWIGVFNKGKGPEDEKHNENALVWDWTPGNEGEITLPATPLESGKFDAYFLWKDGYESLTKSIEVEHKAPEKKEFTVLTYNLWHQGTMVNGYKEKQVEFLKNSGADIVALEESSPERTHELSVSLNWNGFSTDDHGILSRYPITKRYGQHDHGGAVTVALDDNLSVNTWVAHLAYTPYGPYGFCFENKDADAVHALEEESGRPREIQETIDKMKGDLDGSDKSPVLLMGDFNAPSHLDYTEATSKDHCGAGKFEWPTSKIPVDNGLHDSLRDVHPDPVKYPAITWSDVYTKNDDYDGKPEPRDRLDFVYHKGKLTATEAEVVDNLKDKTKPMPDHKDNEWTSDHWPVKVKFRVD